MEKTFKHIWKYISSSVYRNYVDMQMSQQALDAHMNMIRDNLLRSQLPPMLTKYMIEKGIDDLEIAAKLYKAEYGIKRL